MNIKEHSGKRSCKKKQINRGSSGSYVNLDYKRRQWWRDRIPVSGGGDPLLNIKEHSGKRSCKKNNLIKIYFFFYSCCFQRTTPSSPNWTLDFEPAVSPRFFFPLSPRSIFSTGQRFPLSNHVTSGYLWARNPFYPLVSGCPHRKSYDVIFWSRDRSRPIRSQEMGHTGPLYYSQQTCFNEANFGTKFVFKNWPLFHSKKCPNPLN